MIDHIKARTIHRYIRRWNGSKLIWDLHEYSPVVEAIRSAQRLSKKLTCEEIAAQARQFGNAVTAGKEIANLRIPLFALTAEIIRRTLHLDPFDEQLICGIVLDQGKCAQMQTGEGKTLAAVFPAVLNAFAGKGVHVLTFNDYLARRDAEWMRPVFTALGLSVGFVQEAMNLDERRNAYWKDITYCTAREAGFDYLRDNCRFDTGHIVQRGFHYAIVDEADSLLIDEARIPLVIASSGGTHDEHLTVFTRLARDMVKEVHFTFDAYGRKILLTDTGADFAEERLRCGSLYTSENGGVISQLYHALHAEYLLHRNVDYLVRDGKIKLIDELTGRIVKDRRWPEGLHAAVESKEDCTVQPRGAVRNSITMHHFIALYPKVGGMTATAEVAEDELYEWYGLETVIIPPHRRCIRQDSGDFVYRCHEDKQRAVIGEIIKVHASGRPVLVGTRTVQESEQLASILEKSGIRCRVLNAGNDADEAAIIAEAGCRGAVTISTNMAGRGTDIKLGGSSEEEYTEIAALGGLYVIGTNRFESRRVDDQLRGRSGRQGDPGSSRFFISLEDDLFVKYRIRELIPERYIVAASDGRIENVYVNNEVSRLQRIIEGQNGDIKLTLSKYSAIIEQQRQIVAQYRRHVLIDGILPDAVRNAASMKWEAAKTTIGAEVRGPVLVRLLLMALDGSWSSYCADMADLRDGIHFRRFGGQNPLHEYNALAIDRFASVICDAEHDTINRINALSIDDARVLFHACNKGISPSATWTYMVSDNPFEHDPDLQASSNIGYSVFAGLLWPITAMMLIMKKRRKKREPCT